MSIDNKILEKIKKCLRLSKSANQHEAAVALKQAQALMAEHNISSIDVQISEVKEAGSKAGALSRPAQWEAMLVSLICGAFGCRSVLSSNRRSSSWVFFGFDVAPEIASYSFEVIYRQLKRARAEFIITKCKRLKSANKTARADVFCNYWVYGASKVIKNSTLSEEQAEKLALYCKKRFGSVLEDVSPVDRNKNKTRSTGDHEAAIAGFSLGEKAQLHHGVNGQCNNPVLLEG